MESPAIRVLVIDPSEDRVQASEANQTLHVPPLPRELGEGWIGGSSGIGFDWECPSVLPGDGEEFTIASFRQSFTKQRGAQAHFESAVIRHSTLRLKGRCLPLAAPEPAPEEQQAVGILRKTGAAVYLDGFQGDYYEGRPKGSVKRVSWSYQHTGGQQPQVTDADLVYLKQLPELESLSLVGTQVSDDGLMHLKGLAKLQTLDLRHRKVTHAGLAHLKRLRSLQTLNLDETDVGDEGLAHLSALTSLKELHLYRTRVTDAGLEHLKGLSNLETLHLTNTQVTDAGVAHIKELTNLRELFLGHTQITDAGLEQLKELSKLEWLAVDDTQVTDVGLKQIRGLTRLRLLNVGGPGVTDQGVAELRQALPKCEILVRRAER